MNTLDVTLAKLLAILVALQQIASVLVALAPARMARDPRWGRLFRALHALSNLRHADELGTLKLPGARMAPVSVVATSASHAPDADPIVLRSAVTVPRPITPASEIGARAADGDS
jgi:hypothetical protein